MTREEKQQLPACEFCGRPTLIRVGVEYTTKEKGKLVSNNLLVCNRCFAAFTGASRGE